MKQFFFVISILSFFFVKGQDFQGFYTGQLRITDIPERFNVQMDIMEDSAGLSAVFRTRIVDNQQVAGCDNWLMGKKTGNKLQFSNLVPLRTTNIPSWFCSEFASISLEPKKSKDGSGEQEWAGTMYRQDGSVFGRLNLQMVDTTNSYSVIEEREEAAYLMNEKKAFLALTDSARISLLMSGRGVQILDSLVIDTTNSVLKIEAPGADNFHKLTVMINDNVVLIDNAPAQRGTNIRLNNLEEGQLDIIFICYHFMVNTNYNVKLTLVHGNGVQVWEVPVTTYKNRGIRLKVKNSVSPSSGESSD